MNLQNEVLLIFASFVCGVIGYMIRTIMDRRWEIKKSLEEKRRETYKLFLDKLYEIFWTAQGETEKLTQGLKELDKLIGFIALQCSDNIILAYKDFREIARDREKKSSEFNDALAKVLLEMRKDMGYKDTKITKKDILNLLFKQPAEDKSDQSL